MLRFLYVHSALMQRVANTALTDSDRKLAEQDLIEVQAQVRVYFRLQLQSVPRFVAPVGPWNSNLLSL
jgi:hypothetical protein